MHLHRDGARLSQWKRLQFDGVVPKCAGAARWYESVRSALCGEVGHVLDLRWRASALPLREGDFVVSLVAGADEIGRVASVLAPGETMPGTMKKVERGAPSVLSGGLRLPMEAI